MKIQFFIVREYIHTTKLDAIKVTHPPIHTSTLGQRECRVMIYTPPSPDIARSVYQISHRIRAIDFMALPAARDLSRGISSKNSKSSCGVAYFGWRKRVHFIVRAARECVCRMSCIVVARRSSDRSDLAFSPEQLPLTRCQRLQACHRPLDAPRADDSATGPPSSPFPGTGLSSEIHRSSTACIVSTCNGSPRRSELTIHYLLLRDAHLVVN